MIKYIYIVGLIVCLSTALPHAVHGHVGSPNVFYEGDAGPYQVRVVIRPPTAIPGLAEVNVTVEGDDIQQVGVLPALANVADNSLPPADPANVVPGIPHLYSAEVWIMEQGTYAIRIRVQGGQGAGEAVVPMNAFSQAPAEMAGWIQISLVFLGLVLGFAVIASTAIKESGLRPGIDPSPTQMPRLTGSIAALLGLLAAYAMWTAWEQMDRAYRNNELFKPMPITTVTNLVGGRDRLVRITPASNDRGNQSWPKLVTDHGKLMHAFLIREPDLDVFAHVHPAFTPAGNFMLTTPPLPAGDYRLYGDITDESGLSQTVTDWLILPALKPDAPPIPEIARLKPDLDDSWHQAEPFSGPVQEPTTTANLQNGYRMVWDNPEVAQNPGESALKFTVLDPVSQPARLMPYIGMLGHTAVRRDDGAVFAHLHPVGSISMASQEIFQKKEGTASKTMAEGMDHSTHMMGDETAAPNNQLAFPFAFPQTGSYRIWVQVKIGEMVMTAVFDTEVGAI